MLWQSRLALRPSKEAFLAVKVEHCLFRGGRIKKLVGEEREQIALESDKEGRTGRQSTCVNKQDMNKKQSPSKLAHFFLFTMAGTWGPFTHKRQEITARR